MNKWRRWINRREWKETETKEEKIEKRWNKKEVKLLFSNETEAEYKQ